MPRLLNRLWTASAPVTAAGLIMIPISLLCLAGILLDSRVITGAPAWLKPAKFGISTILYCFTLAWIFACIKKSRLTVAAGWVTAAVFMVEIFIIDLQAWRGTTSHFNVGAPLDAALFGIMGVAILILWITQILITGALFRERFTDPVLGWSLRIGMAISVLGSGLGGMMTQPTPAQMEQVRQTHVMRTAGAHTVGGLDGGPGLPLTKWSSEHGDLRVPHFLGLHAMQLVPVLGLFARRARRPAAAVQMLGAAFFCLWGILTWQALRGESIAAPSAATIVAIVVLMLGVSAGYWYPAVRG